MLTATFTPVLPVFVQHSFDIGVSSKLLDYNHTVLEVTRSRCLSQTGPCNTTVLGKLLFLHIPYRVHARLLTKSVVAPPKFEEFSSLQKLALHPFTVVLRALIDTEVPMGNGNIHPDSFTLMTCTTSRATSDRFSTAAWLSAPLQRSKERSCLWALI
jgi:hypothetical protein